MWRNYPEGTEAVIGHLRRGTLLKTDDRGSQQLLDVTGLKSETLKEIMRVQSHGFTSHAPQKSEGVFLSLGGRSDRILALGFEHKDKRPRDLPEGGAALYDADGKILKLIKAETVLDAGKKPVRIVNATTVAIEAADKITLKVGGMMVVIKPDRIDLGRENAPYKVITEGGPSQKVWAIIE